MIDGRYIDCIYKAIEAVEKIEGRDYAYKFGITAFNNIKQTNKRSILYKIIRIFKNKGKNNEHI